VEVDTEEHAINSDKIPRTISIKIKSYEVALNDRVENLTNKSISFIFLLFISLDFMFVYVSS